MKKKETQDKLVKSLFTGKFGSKYFGKHVLLLGNKVYLLPTQGDKARKFIDNLKKNNPGKETELFFVPRPETYIL